MIRHHIMPPSTAEQIVSLPPSHERERMLVAAGKDYGGSKLCD